ncbi:hypothetical protein KGY79_12590, partial [Candidatus Bipolaricaulota bacterium]|nr:hypothetical protein [Candidatus Bipolaricaulota bacterium]
APDRKFYNRNIAPGRGTGAAISAPTIGGVPALSRLVKMYFAIWSSSWPSGLNSNLKREKGCP